MMLTEFVSAKTASTKGPGRRVRRFNVKISVRAQNFINSPASISNGRLTSPQNVQPVKTIIIGRDMSTAVFRSMPYFPAKNASAVNKMAKATTTIAMLCSPLIEVGKYKPVRSRITKIPCSRTTLSDELGSGSMWQLFCREEQASSSTYERPPSLASRHPHVIFHQQSTGSPGIPKGALLGLLPTLPTIAVSRLH